MYLKAGEPLDEDRTQSKIYGEMGASTVWRSGLRRRQGLALWAGGERYTIVEGIVGRSGSRETKGCIMGQPWLGGNNGWHRRKGENGGGNRGDSGLKEAKLSPDFR